MTMGSMASREPDISTGKLVENWPFRVERPEVAVGKHGGEDGQCGNRGPGQREHDLIEGLPLVAAVQIGGFAHLIGDAQIGLAEEEYAESTDQARKYQGKNCIGHAHFSDHLILGDDEDLAGKGHLDEDDHEEDILAAEFQLREGVARHRAEKYGADHPEEYHQRGVDVQPSERQGSDCFPEVVQHQLGREDSGRDLHTFRDGFGAGEQHPYKGEHHHQGANDQEKVSKELTQGVCAPQGSIAFHK